jgi:hypothetical protein
MARFFYYTATLVTLIACGLSAAQGAEPTSKRDKLDGIPLVWKPTVKPSALKPVDKTGLTDVRVLVAPFTDTRSTPGLIGENREEAVARKVVTVNDVAAFVTERMKQVMTNVGIKVVEAGATRVLEGEVKQFFVEEKSRYNAEILLAFTLKDANGKPLWSGTANGSATRFGRSYKADNYYEVLSDSLLQATYSLLGNPSFHEALIKP